ncbi:type II secretion protein [Vibrio parahaemolyticus]|uniref:type II secretion protein n=1 Tax=Vibrio parahaemolyticus TaxID=670 RepID=UPI003891AB93
MHFSDFLKSSISTNEKENITDLLVSYDQELVDAINELYAIEQFSLPMVISEFDIDSIDNFGNTKLSRLILDMRGDLDITNELKKVMDHLDITIQVFVISDVDSVRLEQQVQALGCCYVLWDQRLNGLLSALKSQSETHYNSLSARKAKRVLILGTKGGIGVSSVSTSLVHLMSTQAKLKTLHVEHDTSAVNSDIYLGITDFKIKSSNIDLKEIDKTVSKTYVNNISDKLDYIALEQSSTLSEHFFTLYNISENLKEEYSFIVDSVSLSFFDCLIKDKQISLYDRIYIVCEPSISSLRSYNYLRKKLGKFEHNVIFNMVRPGKDYVMSLSSSKARIKIDNTFDIMYEPTLEKTIFQRGINEISSLKFFKSIANMVNQLSGKELKVKVKLLSFLK